MARVTGEVGPDSRTTLRLATVATHIYSTVWGGIYCLSGSRNGVKTCSLCVHQAHRQGRAYLLDKRHKETCRSLGGGGGTVSAGGRRPEAERDWADGQTERGSCHMQCESPGVVTGHSSGS